MKYGLKQFRKDFPFEKKGASGGVYPISYKNAV